MYFCETVLKRISLLSLKLQIYCLYKAGTGFVSVFNRQVPGLGKTYGICDVSPKNQHFKTTAQNGKFAVSSESAVHQFL
jgi:hypothetical protein